MITVTACSEITKNDLKNDLKSLFMRLSSGLCLSWGRLGTVGDGRRRLEMGRGRYGYCDGDGWVYFGTVLVIIVYALKNFYVNL
jgi:hypothetical protein